MNSSSQSPQGFRFGIFEIDLEARELRKNGLRVKLQDQPFKILAAMVRRAGEIIPREELYAELSSHRTYDSKHGLNNAIQKIREVLGDSPENARFIETVPGRGYRFLPQVEVVYKPSVGDTNRVAAAEDRRSDRLPDVQTVEPRPAPATRPWLSSRSRRRWIAVTGGVVIVGFAALLAAYYFNSRASAAKLTDKDTVVLADFTNTTGDPVFDGTLRQGLSAQLEQSPFLNLLPDRRIAETLVLMSQAKGARLTPELARQVCQRTTSTATIEGSIAKLGSQYVLGLEAANCVDGEVMAREQMTAGGKEQVLKALGEAATKMRTKLGESLISVRKYDVPLESVTTSSLDALQAYSLGYQAQVQQGDAAAAVPLYQRAISLDANFAMAYGHLGKCYDYLGQSAPAETNARKGYELRERVSEREKFYLAAHYDDTVTGNLEAARRTYELWIQTYPRDPDPQGNLGFIYWRLGEYEKALVHHQLMLQLAPSDAGKLANVADAYLYLNHIPEAKAQAQKGHARQPDSPYVSQILYFVAFLQHDGASMERETTLLLGKSDYEAPAFYAEANTAAYAGQFEKARRLTRQAASSASRHSGEKEPAAICEAESAVRESLAGNLSLAKQQAQAALSLSRAKNVEALAAMALGLAGDAIQATQLATELTKGYPEDTIVQSTYLPTIYAVTALQTGREAKYADEAIDALAIAVPHELGLSYFTLYPAYVRGEAYVAAHKGVDAVSEFEKIVNHPSVVLNDVIGALAHLQLGRAYVLAGDTAKAKAAYQDFLTLWKDADQDIPILKQAKAENAKLRASNPGHIEPHP